MRQHNKISGFFIECDGRHAAGSLFNRDYTPHNPAAMAALIQRMIEEMQKQGGIPADKPIKVMVDDNFGPPM